MLCGEMQIMLAVLVPHTVTLSNLTGRFTTRQQCNSGMSWQMISTKVILNGNLQNLLRRKPSGIKVMSILH